MTRKLNMIYIYIYIEFILTLRPSQSTDADLSLLYGVQHRLRFVTVIISLERTET